ncbi:hypothetical protein LJC33_09150, partial [Eubacteriales bacterium OttesenSCG-928-N13]|nr:hypothetical protein [Eubacteriales bacterium OttesenSCG-928-N13]
NKPTRRPPWIAVLVVIVLLCGIAYLLATQLAGWRSDQLREVISIPARSGQAIEPLRDGVIYYDGANLHAMDARGRQIWSYAMGGSASFRVSDGGVATWSGTMLSLLSADDGSSSFSGHLESTVVSARYGSNYIAVQIADESKGSPDEHNSTMLLLDSGGRQVDRIALTNQTVLDFGFFHGGTLFWVMSLDTEGTTPVCSVSTYRPGKMRAGTVTDTSQVLYEVLFQSSNIRVVGLTYIKDFLYTNSEVTENRMLVYGWYMLDVDENQQNPFMVFVPTSQADGTSGISDIRTIQGQVDTTIRLPAAAKQVFASGNTVYAFANDRVMVCASGSSEPATYALPIYIDQVLSLTDNHTAIVSSGGDVYLIPLP